MSTKIEWVKNEDGTQGETFNPVMGCTPISEGCTKCYSRAMIKRYKGSKGWPNSPEEVTLFPERLEKPFHWKKQKRIFVCSMSDLFHDDIPFEFIAAVFGVMAATPRHTYMILTKRPARMLEFYKLVSSFDWSASVECADQLLSSEARNHPKGFSGPIHCKYGPDPDAPWPLPNVHIGVSVENQATADERIPLLLQTPASKRFVSYEPALGPICFNVISKPQQGLVKSSVMDRHGYYCGIDQIICGAETGPGARPMDLDWARSVRDQCQAAGVPFFFKKNSNGNRKLDGIMHEGKI